MQTILPDGTITAIDENTFTVKYRHDPAAMSIISITRLPRDAKVGDSITVTLKTKVEKVELNK